MRYLTLAEALTIAEAVTGTSAAVLARASRLDLLDSALHAPQAGFGEVEFYPYVADKAAVLVVRIAKNHAANSTKSRWPPGSRNGSGRSTAHNTRRAKRHRSPQTARDPAFSRRTRAATAVAFVVTSGRLQYWCDHPVEGGADGVSARATAPDRDHRIGPGMRGSCRNGRQHEDRNQLVLFWTRSMDVSPPSATYRRLRLRSLHAPGDDRGVSRDRRHLRWRPQGDRKGTPGRCRRPGREGPGAGRRSRCPRQRLRGPGRGRGR